MSLFDTLVATALKNNTALSPLRVVVEKELLHHDILRAMSDGNMLKDLTFIGGTCLRTCYGSERLSEDLDFTGGNGFTRDVLKDLSASIQDRIGQKYGLKVAVSEPQKECGNMATWKVHVITRPARTDLPQQRINIDICAVTSHIRRPMMLRNLYGVDMGTGGLLIQAESMEEILADKVIALAQRPNRIKNRDLWDFMWLTRRNVELSSELVLKKLNERHLTQAQFNEALSERLSVLQGQGSARDDFLFEMRRFLPPSQVHQVLETDDFWVYLIDLVTTECAPLLN